MAKKSWSDLTEQQRTAIVAGGAFEAVLTAIALRDLARRPGRRVRGSKALWALGCVVQPIGPVAYLAWGRRK